MRSIDIKESVKEVKDCQKRDLEKAPHDKISPLIQEGSSSEDRTASEIGKAISGFIANRKALNEPSLTPSTTTALDNLDSNLQCSGDDMSTSAFIQLNDFWLSNEKSVQSNIDSSSEIRSPVRHPCYIEKTLWYNYSVKEDLLSMFKVSVWLFMATICGIGYEGRLMMSKWFVILETIHHYPAAIGIGTLEYTLFDIAKKSLHRIFTILMALVWHFVLVTTTWLDVLVFGHLANGVVAIVYTMAVYVFCSRKFYMRATYFFLWFGG